MRIRKVLVFVGRYNGATVMPFKNIFKIDEREGYTNFVWFY